MPRGRRARPLLPPLEGGLDRAADRLHRLFRKSPGEARSRTEGRPELLALLHARLAAEKALAGDAPGALAEARAASAVRGGMRDATAAAFLAAADAEVRSGSGAGAESILLEAFAAAEAPLGRGTALARLALLYRDRGIPLGFRFYAPRALRVLDRGHATGIHAEADLDAARLATAVLEYHHRRDEPERSGRAFAVLERVRDADAFTTVQGLKYQGVALGKLQEWEASWKAFADAARLAEEHDLRGCDGVFVYAAAVKVHEKDFPGARRLLSRVHIRRLDAPEKNLYRQFRHLVEAASELKPLPADQAEKFLRAQRRREKAAEKKALESSRAAAPAAAAAPAPAKAKRAKKPARRRAKKPA